MEIRQVKAVSKIDWSFESGDIIRGRFSDKLFFLFFLSNEWRVMKLSDGYIDPVTYSDGQILKLFMPVKGYFQEVL